MADKTAQTIYIDADPATVMDVIADIGSYPDWVAEYKETEVLEADKEGYPKTARLVLDAAVLNEAATGAANAPESTVNFQYVFAAGQLVQAVDVLRHQGKAVAEALFQLSQGEMSRVGFDRSQVGAA